MIIIDYYKILGISSQADEKEIKQAFRERAKAYHPDVSDLTDSKKKFQLINEAYQTLIDNKSRRIYDFKMRYHSVPHTTGKRRNREFTSYYDNYSKTRENYYQYYGNPFFNMGKIKTFDLILFYSMVVIGLLAVIFGIIDLFFSKWIGLQNITGLLFGLSFLFLLIYGWNLMWNKRESKK